MLLFRSGRAFTRQSLTCFEANSVLSGRWHASQRVRAHMPRQKAPSAGGKPGVLGVRREDKNKWERRVPVAPRHVEALVSQGLRVLIQPCTRRVFTDAEYEEAGAELREDLSEASTIIAVKEVPPELLLPGRNWVFFSHTIKAQPAGMPLLDAAIEKKVRLVDYECITERGARGNPRLVAFGAFAGYAGAIDFLRGLGERFLALGFSTPLLHIGSAFMYPTLDEAKRAVSLAGEAIRKHGLPKALCPFTAVFTGTGNVSRGALEIFQLLPHEIVDPGALPELCERADRGQLAKEDCHKLYLSIATTEHMVRRSDGGPFDKLGYYAQPELYEPIFQDAVLPYSTVILNGMYWEARFPRLFTREDLHRHVVSGHDKLLGVCDITCDADGSVPTSQFSSIEQPFYVLNALTDKISLSLDEAGVLFHAVDHLPSELPREASEHFGDCLLPFLPVLASELAPTEPSSSDRMAGSENLPMPIRGAIITEGGALARDFRYIPQLRELSQGEAVQAEVEAVHVAQQGAHGTWGAPPACCTLELTGHIFDSRLINRVADLIEEDQGRLQILALDVGRSVGDQSFFSFLVMAHSEERLGALVGKIQVAADEAKSTLRHADPGALQRGADGSQAAPSAEVAAGASPRKVLVLGAGYVAHPLVERLLRRPENALTVASLYESEVEALRQRVAGGNRVKAESIDLAAAEAGSRAAQEKMSALVQESDLVISLAPAQLHVGVAKLAIQHGVPMVTASYVSPEMHALSEDAEKAGVLILNEVGLDPGIDHLSAMKMIDAAKDAGSEVLRFSSLCGGLPAPEAAGSNPIGYKFSWSPRGVLVASRNPARYREDGRLREIQGEDLLRSGRPITINNAFALDVLPNRDSTSFAELYGLADAPTFFRGTLRYRGFCERMLALSHLGLLDAGRSFESYEGWSRRRWLAQLLGAGDAVKGAEAAEALAEQPALLVAALRARLVASGSDPEAGLEFLAWLGLLEEAPLPDGSAADRPLDVTALLLQRPETAFQPGERDMVIMRHELDVRRREGGMERHVSTLVEYGQPNGTTAMAKTVGLTAAICAQLVLDSPKERFGAGVQRPLRPAWYEPVLPLLEAEGIRLSEHVEPLA
mmetsp:Transcript_71797/g.126776  ORF Transcript_71797/g.126776 Transcript_71797/m.126776 type:complete len:1110 (-) Transcript_71797:14-3343(-)